MEGIAIAESLLRIVAAVVPGVLAATAGTQTDEEAIEAMSSTAKRLKNREDSGTWDADLQRRKRKGHRLLTDGNDE